MVFTATPGCAWSFTDLQRAKAFIRARPALAEEWHTHELGPEVKEPDYGPLMAFLQAHRWIVRPLRHGASQANDDVQDALEDALEAAGLLP